MRRVKDYCINTLGNKSINTLHRVSSNTNTSSYAKTTLAILTSIWMILNLCKVFVCDKTNKMTLGINNWQLLNLITQEHLSNILSIRIGDSYQILRGHNLGNLATHILLETKVAIGNNTHKHTILIHYRNTANLVLTHQCKCVTYSLLASNCDWVVNHTILSTLYTTNLSCLLSNRHILVNNTNTSLTSDSDSHWSLGNSVHCCRYDRNIECNVARKTALQTHLTRQHLRVSWHQQNIIKGQTLLLNSLC